MKTGTPRGIWGLRGVTAAIFIIILIVVATVVYSAYEDYNGVRSGIAAGNRLIAAGAVYDQATGAETVSFNVTIPNRGVYSLNVTLACSSSNRDVACPTATAIIPPGAQRVLHFRLTVSNVQQFLASGDHQINGTLGLALEPLVSLSVGVNFTGFVQLPGGP